MRAARGSAEGGREKAAAAPRVSRTGRDVMAGGITVAAIILFVSTGGNAMAALVRGMTGGVADRALVVTLLLNIALILFGWRRYRDFANAARDRDDAEARARTLVANDALTGLYNRRGFAEAAAALLAQGERRERALALFVIDLDQFHSVNDVHGHQAGDRALKAAAAAIASALPPSALVARVGGDSFAVAMACDPANNVAVEAAADHLVAAFGTPLRAEGHAFQLSASIGVARSEPGTTTEALIGRAEIAMREAKARGRNRSAWFDPGMERELLARNALEAGIREGIAAGQFVPYYEQQIDLSTGQLLGFEVLARWEHPTHGLIPPDSFIPVAEEIGALGDLSMAVMRQAFEEAKSWDSSLTLSVNISPGQLKDAWLAQKIVRLLVETGFPATRLEVEITETALLNNLGLAQSIVGSLKNQGIRLALDDFGTGYSSLAHLRALPFDRIKIDKSFVTSINADAESAAIVDAITKLGDSLNLPITAEGIEDAAIEARLKGFGCTKGQGWHFGKPAGIAATRRLLAERGLLPSARGVSSGEQSGRRSA